MLRILACDEEKEYLTDLTNILKTNLTLEYTIVVTSNVGEMEEYLSEFHRIIDVLLMDVEICGENGIELAAQIMKKYNHLQIVFISGFVGKYLEELFLWFLPYGILRKPLRGEFLCTLLNKLYQERAVQKDQYLSLKIKSGARNISYHRIRYIESNKRKLYIHLEEEVVSCYASLTQLHKILPDNFLYCHKSFIVNMDYILKFSSKEITLMDHTIISVSKSNAVESRKLYFAYIGLKI